MKILIVICCILTLQSSLGVCDTYVQLNIYQVHSHLKQNGNSEEYATCVTDYLTAEVAKFGDKKPTDAESALILNKSYDKCRFVGAFTTSSVLASGIILAVVLIFVLISLYANYRAKKIRSRELEAQKLFDRTPEIF